MTNAQPKLVLSPSRDIPFSKLILSQANVRRTKAGTSIEELAEDISRRGLLQSLNVRPVRAADGGETGTYEVPAGGRRFRALELLVKQKRMSRTQLVPCVVREDGMAEEDSLAENVQRVALHPLDQFRAFRTLRDAGLSEEDIAARFFVGANVVKQRLKLAAVSPKLLDIYAEDGMTLEQLMAFTVTNDNKRQEQVWEGLSRSYSREPYTIRRQLTEGAIGAGDRRALFVGIEAYEAAGGIVLRDLFCNDNGGWLQDTALLDRLAIEKLTAEAEALRAEGWKWIEVAIEFPYGHTAGLRRLTGTAGGLQKDEEEVRDRLLEEQAQLEEQYGAADELPDEVYDRLQEIEERLEDFADAPLIYAPTDMARAGVFVSISNEGLLRIDRGYVRREDEPAADGETVMVPVPGAPPGSYPNPIVIVVADSAEPEGETGEEEDEIKPLSERLVTELTAHRTVALRDALAGDPEIAFVAVLHVLCLKAFYRYATDSCLEIDLKSASFSQQAPGLADSDAAKAIDARHDGWARRLPQEPGELWDALIGLDEQARAELFAHCAALSVNAVHESWSRNPRRLAHADEVARAVDLDMAAQWTPTVENYLGRVTKARILEAVREAKGDSAAQLIDHLRKPEMAKEAARLLEGTGWLPEPLRLAEPEVPAEESAESLPDFLDDGAAEAPVAA